MSAADTLWIWSALEAIPDDPARVAGPGELESDAEYRENETEVDDSVLWECPFCYRALPNEHAPCCGEAGCARLVELPFEDDTDEGFTNTNGPLGVGA